MLREADMKCVRLRNEGRWNLNRKKHPAAHHTPNHTVPRPPRRRCFNCGSESHILNQCNKPKDEKRIAAKRKEFDDELRVYRQAKQAKLPGGTPAPAPAPEVDPTSATLYGIAPFTSNKHGKIVPHSGNLLKIQERMADKVIASLAKEEETPSESGAETKPDSESTDNEDKPASGDRQAKLARLEALRRAVLTGATSGRRAAEQGSK